MELPDAAAFDVAEVERAAALGWRGLKEQRLGDWLLRAGGGFTGRANDDGVVLAIGRAAVTDGWVGLTAVEVTAGVRRQGLGARVVRALLERARAGAEGDVARSAYLQVSPDNSAALALYASLGFVHHHTYVYLTPG